MHEHNHQMSQNNKRHRSFNAYPFLERNICGGSLNGLNSRLCGDYLFADQTNNYFNKNKQSSYQTTTTKKTTSVCTDNFHRTDSYLDLHEYTSTPYYQYMRKNLLKRDFGGNTVLTFSYISPMKKQVDNNKTWVLESFW